MIHRIKHQRDTDREIIIYIEYRSISFTNLSLSMSPAAMEGLGIGAGGGLQSINLHPIWAKQSDGRDRIPIKSVPKVQHTNSYFRL